MKKQLSIILCATLSIASCMPTAAFGSSFSSVTNALSSVFSQNSSEKTADNGSEQNDEQTESSHDHTASYKDALLKLANKKNGGAAFTVAVLSVSGYYCYPMLKGVAVTAYAYACASLMSRFR